jgi:hydrogenase maturation protease
MTSEPPRVLVACIGNIFLGDDAFGVEVAKLLAARPLPEGVRVVDFGIRGIDLTYALLDDYDVTIFVDTVSRGGAPGTVYVIEPDPTEIADTSGVAAGLQGHELDPLAVLRVATAMGATVRRLLLVGCEPETFGPEEGRIGLSEPVGAAVAEAAAIVESLVARAVGEARGASERASFHRVARVETSP